jgi:hypothetical protein
MKHSHVYAVALILGSLGSVVTMIFHPTGQDLLGQPDEIARRNEIITVAMHSLALFSSPVLFFGFFGLSRRLGFDHPLVAAALVSYGFALLGGTCAAVFNGLVAPVITRQILTADEHTGQLLRLILMNNTLMNQAFSKIYLIASSLAIIFWSARMIRNGGLARIAAALGCVIGLLSVLGLFSGHLRINAHGFGLLIFGQMIWACLAAGFLFSFGNSQTEGKI